MPINLKQNDPKLWTERNEFIARLKTLVGFCEILDNKSSIRNISVHEFLIEYSKKHKPEVNRLILLHPGNCIVLHNDLHINNKPSVEACIVALYRRRFDVCRQLGFPNGKAMVADFCRKVIKLQQDGFIKVLPPYILTLSGEYER